MGTATNVALLDGAAGATHTFVPQIKGPGKVSFINLDSDLAAASERLVSLFKPSNSQRNTTRYSLDLDFPLKRSDGGTPAVYSVAGHARFNGQYVLPTEMTTTEREEFAYMVGQMVQNALLVAGVEDLDPPS